MAKEEQKTPSLPERLAGKLEDAADRLLGRLRDGLEELLNPPREPQLIPVRSRYRRR
jgi:hypothetical protein